MSSSCTEASDSSMQIQSSSDLDCLPSGCLKSGQRVVSHLTTHSFNSESMNPPRLFKKCKYSTESMACSRQYSAKKCRAGPSHTPTQASFNAPHIPVPSFLFPFLQKKLGQRRAHARPETFTGFCKVRFHSPLAQSEEAQEGIPHVVHAQGTWVLVFFCFFGGHVGTERLCPCTRHARSCGI